jgi:hypothetical protein
VGLFLAACAAGVLLIYGPDTTYDNDNVRMVFTLLLLAVVFVLAAGSVQLKIRAGRDTGLIDERDQAILDRAPATQGTATILTLAVWVVGLTERFHEPGAVPLFYVMLLFWSCLVVHLLGLPLGVLIGYRRR